MQDQHDDQGYTHTQKAFGLDIHAQKLDAHYVKDRREGQRIATPLKLDSTLEDIGDSDGGEYHVNRQHVLSQQPADNAFFQQHAKGEGNGDGQDQCEPVG